MKQDLFNKVDSYFEDMLVPEDPVLTQALENSHKGGLPPHQVSATQAKFLQILAQSIGAKKILEVGTLGGFSTIWLGRALPEDGTLITLEAVDRHAAVAQANIARAEIPAMVDVRLGQALDLLPGIEKEGHAPFDMIFIDADKQNNPAYFDWALKLSRKGSLIIIDNVVRGGQVIKESSDDPSIQGVRALHDKLKTETRVNVTSLQTVGCKGYDGFTIAVVL